MIHPHMLNQFLCVCDNVLSDGASLFNFFQQCATNKNDADIFTPAQKRRDEKMRLLNS